MVLFGARFANKFHTPRLDEAFQRQQRAFLPLTKVVPNIQIAKVNANGRGERITSGDVVGRSFRTVI